MVFGLQSFTAGFYSGLGLLSLESSQGERTVHPFSHINAVCLRKWEPYFFHSQSSESSMGIPLPLNVHATVCFG